MPNPAPRRQRIRDFPTPKIADVIIRESLDTTRITTLPSYGDAHPDTTNYANYIFVHAKTVEDQGLWLEMYYAKDRTANQEDYNYSLTYQGNDPNYPIITRTYILRRGENQLDLGSADPRGAAQAGGTVMTSTGGSLLTSTGGVIYTSGGTAAGIPVGVLVAQAEKPLPEPLGSMYVEVTRIYQVIPGSETPTESSGSTQNDSGYIVERPIQDKNWVRLTWKLMLPRETADNYRSTSFAQCIIPGYTNLTLIDERIEAVEDNNQVSNLVRVYAGNVDGSNSPSVPVVRFRHDLPGVMPPDKFLENITERTDIYEVIDPANAAYTEQSGDVPTGYTLFAILVEPDGTNSGRRSVVTKVYGTPVTLTGRTYDENLRQYVPYTTRVVSTDEAPSITAALGEEITVTPLNAYWVQITTETPAESALSILGGSATSYYTTVPFSWPAVIVGAITLWPVNVKDPDTGEVIETINYPDYTIKKSWSGICRARVDIGWTKTPPLATAIDSISQMKPEAIEINWPILQLSIPPTLHRSGTLTANTASNHPRYGPGAVVFTKTVSATNPTDWPDELVIDYNIQPYKGGYRIRRVTVYSPDVSTTETITA